MSTDGKTESSWFGGVDIPKFPALDHDRTCDICIIGAGIAGLSVAYQLVRAGKSVIVIDDSQVGDGQTGRTSAHLASEWDDRYFEAERSVGKEMAKLIFDSHSKAIDAIESIAKAEKIDCDFQRVDGWLFLGPNEKEKTLDDELEAAKRAGFEDIEKKSSLKIDGHDFGPALRFGRQAQFHPMRYLVGLARAITEAGGQIFCGDRVIDVQGRDPKTNEDAVTTTQRGVKIVSQHIAVCTNTPAPINDWMGIYLKQASYRTYVVAARMPKGAIAPALYWDTNDPYHYVRVQPASTSAGAAGNHDLLLIGGEDHKTGQAPEHGEPLANLEKWAKERFANLGAIEFRWSGQVQEPDDGVAFIGRAPHKKENVYVCTGDSGMGLTHGTIAGLLISDQILGRTNPWEALYDPSRKQTGALTEFIKENVNVATEYGKYLTGGEVSKADEIQAGSGAIMREGLKKLAVYRDDAGQVHKVSAVCTHLGCIVAWNSVEKTWDCPCHGARYDALGKVVMGPAIDDLSAAE